MIRLPLFPITAALALALPAPAAAADWTFSPKLSGTVAMEVQNDAQVSSDDPAEEFNNLFLKVEPGLTLSLTEGLSVNAGLVLEQVQDPAFPGDDRAFADQGLYVQVLTLDYEDGPWRLSGGKMHVTFGQAWDVTPGVFGTDLAEEYEMSENIALAAAYSHDFGAAGTHTLTAQTFFLDTSGLAESAFTRRRKTRGGDGGPGNTGGFSSFALAVDGGKVPGLEGFRYHLAYVHHANDSAGASDESRFAVNAGHEFSLPGGITAGPFVEYVRLGDADGTANQDRGYLTAAVGFGYENWNLALSGTFKETDAADGTETEESQLQVSAGYAFPVGVTFDVAYKRVRNAGTDTDVFGTLVTYALEF